MKTLYLTLGILLISSLAFGQIDTSNAGHFENRLLQNISIIKSDPGEATLIPDGPPTYPVEPFTEPTIIEPCTLKRLVFFIHGLGGSNTAWQRAATAMMLPAEQGQNFEARYCEAIRLGYAPTYSSLNAAAIDMRQEIILKANQFAGIPGYNPDKSLNFIIAHSQGGVVTRTLAHNDIVLGRDGYGGYVTVASSVQGAQILNNISSLYFFAEEGCKKMLTGPLTEITPVTIFAKVNDILYGLNHVIVDKACGAVPGVLPELFKDFTYKLTDDYKVWSPHIATLNNSANHPSLKQLHKIAFYGVEPKENLIWRTLNWMLYDVNNEQPWMANDDFKLLNEKVIPVRNDYFSSYLQNQVATDIFKACANSMITPYLSNQMNKIARKYEKRALEWKKGVDWLDKATSGWSAIIGAIVEQPIGTGCFCHYMDGGIKKQISATDCNACYILFPTNLISADPVTFLAWTYKENDGIVLAESAKDLPGASFPPQKLNGIEDPGKLPTGSSHFQVRNDRALRDHLTLLLNGKLDQWFELATY